MKWLMALIGLSLLAAGSASAATTGDAHEAPAGFVDRPVVALDWTLAETLTGLGVRAMGVGQVETYASWVAQPALPQGTRDLGLRTQPNLEQLAA
ncbi:MAG: hypothetical protein ACTH7C_12495, partial [Cobetia marina]